MSNKKINVDTLIISDIHLGLKFSRVEKLLATLKNYKFNRLILNGDIFHGLDFNRLNSEHWEVLSFFRYLSKRAEVVWIIGNHDGRASVMSRLMGINVRPEYQWRAGNKKCLAIHGHQYDRFISKNKFISDVATAIFFLVKNFEGQNKAVSEWVKKNNRSWLRLSDEVAFKALRYGRAKGVNYVFCGHTHLARTLDLYGMSYWNSGCWVDSPSHLITLKGDKVELVAVK